MISIVFALTLVRIAMSSPIDVSNAELDIGGQVQPGWESVRDLFRVNFEDQSDLGASLAVYYRGELVVNIWGGWFDEQRTESYTDDTLQLVFSTSKGLVAAAIALCVQRGLL
jgi:CubicO group peptidase (beta-lactamase class C family)